MGLSTANVGRRIKSYFFVESDQLNSIFERLSNDTSAALYIKITANYRTPVQTMPKNIKLATPVFDKTSSLLSNKRHMLLKKVIPKLIISLYVKPLTTRALMSTTVFFLLRYYHLQNP